MQVTAGLIAAGNKLLLKIHALVSLFPVLYLPSIPGLPLLLLFVFISLSFILPKTPLTCHFFLKYRARLIFLSLCSSLNNAIQLFDIMLLYTICFWLSGGVVCKMLKQAIWKVLSERVVLDYGDKLLLPCLYLPTTSFHAGQMGVGEYDQRENIRYGDSQPSSGFLDT
ncbi:uncharacterized protein [Gossypium hirsutum]|uniref:Uncharacterized protein isoform X3 n=1 Tax=Gossypium hirsutum TaxID=3635 RepID=A0ABM3AJS3_GOSHI|nr:uncharacterized protein LOC107911857 isoform X3 [Gossypium hirsutum]